MWQQPTAKQLGLLPAVLTFTGTALSYQPNHQGGALVALCRGSERLHEKLMSLALQSN